MLAQRPRADSAWIAAPSSARGLELGQRRGLQHQLQVEDAQVEQVKRV